MWSIQGMNQRSLSSVLTYSQTHHASHAVINPILSCPEKASIYWLSLHECVFGESWVSASVWEPTEWTSEFWLASPSFFSLLSRRSVSLKPYLLLITGPATGSPIFDVKAPVARLKNRSHVTRVCIILKTFLKQKEKDLSITFRTCSIHNIRCFRRRSRRRSNRRFLRLVRCLGELSRKPCPARWTQTDQRKKDLKKNKDRYSVLLFWCAWGDVLGLEMVTLQFGRQSATRNEKFSWIVQTFAEVCFLRGCSFSEAWFIPWLMKAAGPSQSWAQFLRVEYMTLKSFSPWRNSMFSSLADNSAMQPTRCSILSFLFLNGCKK